MKTKSGLIDYKEAADFIGLAEFTLRRYVSEKKIPYYKIGSRVFFKPEELEAWINSRRVEAIGGVK